MDVAFFKRFLIGSHASDMDVPEHRLAMRVTAEVAGLPADFAESFPERVNALTPAVVNAAIKRHVHAREPDDRPDGSEVLRPLLSLPNRRRGLEMGHRFSAPPEHIER